MSEIESGLELQDLGQFPHGNVVFFESGTATLNNRRVLEKMSNALDLLSIPNYAIQLDDMVDEAINETSTKPEKRRKKSLSRPRYMVGNTHSSQRLKGKPEVSEPNRRPRRKAISQRSRELKAKEAEMHLDILCMNIREVAEANPDGWVLIVETEMKRALDILKLDDLAEHFSFKIHWFTTGSKKRSELRFNEIVADILKDKNERRRRISGLMRTPCDTRIIKNSKAADHSSDLETLHRFQQRISPVSSKCSTGSSQEEEDYDTKSNKPPHFRHGRRMTQDSSENLDGQESVSTLVTTDSGASLSSVFEVRSNESMSLFQNLPPPNLDRLLDIGTRDSKHNIVEVRKTFVVTIRDLFPGARSHLALTLKSMLRREGIRTYIMTVSNMFTQPHAVKLMKQYSVEAGHGPTEMSKGCKILLMNGIHYKLSEQKHQVILVDLEDESIVRLFTIYDFCIQIGVKTLALEKAADGSFERNLNKVYQTIRKGISGPHKPRKYRLPKITSELLQTLKPVVVVGSRLIIPGQSNTLCTNQNNPELNKDLDLDTDNTPEELEPDENRNDSTEVVSDASIEVAENITRNYENLLDQQSDSKDFCTTTYYQRSVSVSSIDSEDVAKDALDSDLEAEYVAARPKSNEDEYNHAPGSSSSSLDAPSEEMTSSLAEEADDGDVTSKSQTTVVQKPSFPGVEVILTDEEGHVTTAIDYFPRDPPRPVKKVTDDSDTDTPHFKPPNRQKLIEIRRWEDRAPVGKKRDLRYLTGLPKNRVENIDTSDESLFKGWVGKVSDPSRDKKPSLFKRFRSAFMKYIIRPIGRLITGRK